MVSPIIVMSLATTCGCLTLLVSTSPMGSWASSVSLRGGEERGVGGEGWGGEGGGRGGMEDRGCAVWKEAHSLVGGS